MVDKARVDKARGDKARASKTKFQVPNSKHQIPKSKPFKLFKPETL
jgi:hypothetical protein